MTTASARGATRRLLGLFAHPDDESFCAGGTFAKYAAEGAEIMVVSATRGEAGQIRDAAIATRHTLGETRARELQTACGNLGVTQAICLDYGDGKLQGLPPETLVAEFVGIIRSFRPDVVITFGEDGAYGHPDHIAVSMATTSACHAAGDAARFPEQLVEGLAPYAPSRLYYSHFPHSATLLMQELVTWLSGQTTKFRGGPDFAGAMLLFAQESTTLRFNSDFIEVTWYPPGFYIVEQGEPSVSLYLVLSGGADVFVEDADGDLRLIDQLGPGDFFGEIGLAYGKPRMAHVVARESVSCLVFSPGKPTAFAGRGEEAGFAVTEAGQAAASEANSATTCIDVGDYVGAKIRAISAHRTQYPITENMFPHSMLRQIFGQEYFVRVLPRTTWEDRL